MFASLGMNEIMCEDPGLTNVIGFSSGQLSGFGLSGGTTALNVPWSTFQHQIPTQGRVLHACETEIYWV